MTLLAVGDESMRQRHDGSGIYVIAAPFFDQAHIADLRAEAAELASGKSPFHWRDEGPRRRRRAIQLLARLDALHIVAVGRGLDNARQERGRRQVLRTLLWHLHQAGVGEIWLDARRPNQNRYDIALFDSLRMRNEIPEDFGVRFFLSQDEPLLWLADVVAGAVSAAWGDGNDRYLQHLLPMLEVHEIDLD